MSYSAKIIESSKELSLVEKIRGKDLSVCKSLDEVVGEFEQAGEKFHIDFAYYMIIHIVNDKSEDKEYDNYVIVDRTGESYRTGSNSFWESFKDIYNEVRDAGEENFTIECYRKPSKNYANKYFLSCTIA